MSIVRAMSSFAYTDHHGVPRVVSDGDLFDSGDPCVLKRPKLFAPVETVASRATETATAAPGEVRHRPGRRKKAVSETADDQPEQ